MSHLAIWFRVTGSPVFGVPPDHDVPEHFYTQASSAENGVGALGRNGGNLKRSVAAAEAPQLSDPLWALIGAPGSKKTQA